MRPSLPWPELSHSQWKLLTSEMLTLRLLKLNSPKLHGGKQPSALLTLPPRLVLLWCFSVGVSHLGVNSSCLVLVGGQGRLGWAPSTQPWSYFFLKSRIMRHRERDLPLTQGEKLNQLFCGSAVLGMGQWKTQPCQHPGPHWLNLRAKKGRKSVEITRQSETRGGKACNFPHLTLVRGSCVTGNVCRGAINKTCWTNTEPLNSSPAH